MADAIDRLHRRGKLTAAMAEAGARFHRIYVQDPASTEIIVAIAMLGGLESRAARAMLAIAGEGRTIAALAREVGVPPEVGLGLLLAGLGVLAAQEQLPSQQSACNATRYLK